MQDTEITAYIQPPSPSPRPTWRVRLFYLRHDGRATSRTAGCSSIVAIFSAVLNDLSTHKLWFISRQLLQYFLAYTALSVFDRPPYPHPMVLIWCYTGVLYIHICRASHSSRSLTCLWIVPFPYTPNDTRTYSDNPRQNIWNKTVEFAHNGLGRHPLPPIQCWLNENHYS